MLAAAAVVAGCSREETYRPNLRENPPAAVQSSTKAPEPATYIGKVGGADLTGYAIPLFPDAKVDEEAALAYRDADKSSGEIHVKLDSYAEVREIADWYKKHIKAEHGQGSADLAGLEGTTTTGYPLNVSIAKIETKSIIAIAVHPKPE
jgi:hypothetical protein